MDETGPKPIPKNHHYYSTADNLWNNAYLSSAKIAQFYHKPNQSYTASQPQPVLSPSHSLKAKEERAHSLLRHRLRKEERLAVTLKQLEARCRGKSDLQGSPQRSRMWSARQAAQVAENSWEKIEILPRQKLTQFITRRCVEMDECRD